MKLHVSKIIIFRSSRIEFRNDFVVFFVIAVILSERGGSEDLLPVGSINEVIVE